MPYSRGDDTEAIGDLFPVYRISKPDHANVIEVYGDEELRDRILAFLRADELICKP